MPTTAKAQTIDELTEQLTNAKLIVLTDYRGLRVADLQDLRGNLRKSGGEFRVAKNTLTRIAAVYDGDTGAGTDANIVPIFVDDFAFTTPTSGTIGYTVASGGFARAA